MPRTPGSPQLRDHIFHVAHLRDRLRGDQRADLHALDAGRDQRLDQRHLGLGGYEMRDVLYAVARFFSDFDDFDPVHGVLACCSVIRGQLPIWDSVNE